MNALRLLLLAPLTAGIASAPVRADTLGQLRVDARLAAKGNVLEPRSQLKTITAQLSRQTGICITPAPRIAGDRVTCLVRDRRAGEVLAAICQAMHYVVRRDESGGYLLDLHPAVAEKLAEAARALSKVDQEVAEAKRRGVEQRIQELLTDAPGGNQPEGRVGAEVLAQVLQTLTPEQRSALADAASEPFGVISAQNNDHLASRTFGMKALSSYPPSVQQALRGVLSASPALRQQFGNENDPLVGLVAHDGGLGLACMAGPNIGLLPGKAGGHPGAGIVVDQGRAIKSQLGARIQQMEDGEPGWLDPVTQQLPLASTAKWDGKALTIPSPGTERQLRGDHMLEAYARLAHVDVVGDSFTRSTFLYATSPTFSWPGAATPRNWARHLAVLFQRKYQCREGLLMLRSRHPMLERLVEVPSDLEDELTASKRENGRLELENLTHAAVRLSTDQIHTLNRIITADGISFAADALSIERNQRLLRFIGNVSGGGVVARSGVIKAASIAATDRPTFNRLFWTGQPIATISAREPVTWDTNRDVVVFTFYDGEQRLASEQRIALGGRRTVTSEDKKAQLPR